MAKSKLTEENKGKIYRLLSEGQTQRYVCQEIGVSEKTFFNWIKNDSEFAQMVENAKQEYRDNCDDDIKELAQNRIEDLVRNGHIVRVTRTSKNKIIRRYPVYKKDSNEIKYWKTRFEDEAENTDTTETNFGTPQWAIDRIRPKVDLEQAFRTVQSHGYAVIIDPDQIATHQRLLQLQTESQSSQSNNKGISQERENEVKARIMGISEDATRTSGVPKEMGNG